jgi:hypothetical protein
VSYHNHRAHALSIPFPFSNIQVFQAIVQLRTLNLRWKSSHVMVIIVVSGLSPVRGESFHISGGYLETLNIHTTTDHFDVPLLPIFPCSFPTLIFRILKILAALSRKHRSPRHKGLRSNPFQDFHLNVPLRARHRVIPSITRGH